MEYARHIREFPHDIHTVSVGIPFVDNHRQLRLPRQLHLHFKGFYLDLPIEALVIIVQSDLTNGFYLGVLAHFQIGLHQLLAYLPGRIRVGAYRGVNKGIFFRQGNAVL